MTRVQQEFSLLLSILLLAGCMAEPEAESAAAAGSDYRSDAPAVTPIEALYSEPSIIGTSPEGAVWSPDGSKLAFLWNREGRGFREVWSYSLPEGEMTQLTTHGAAKAGNSESEGISEVAWLGSGMQLAYVLDGQAYLLGEEGESEPLLLNAQGGVSELRLSPQGDRLAYIQEGALWIRDTGAEPVARQLVAPGHERVFVERYEWSADGRQIAFLLADNRDVRQIEIHYSSGGESATFRTTRAFPGDETPKRRVGVAAVENAEVTWFERPDEQDPVWGFGLSADGGRLFIDSSDFLIKKRTIYVYDVASAERQVFFESKDPKKVLPGWSAAWAPGDNGLIVLSDHGGWFHLYHQPDAGTPAEQLTSGSWEIASFEVDAENGRIYFLANEAHRSELQLYRIPAKGGEVERLTKRPGTHAPVFSPDFSLAADRYSSDTTPPDLYLKELGTDAEARRITDSPQPGFAKLPLADVSYIEFNSHVDGTPLLGRLSVPPEFDPNRRYPLLMGSIYPNSVRNRWGAGNAIPTWGLDQHLVERGYVLMKVDVRGSWGHGKEVRQGLFRDYGGIDKDDVHSGVLHLIDAGFVDPERVGMWGWSYGGLMTLMSLFHKPDLYAVGIADAPATNVAHAFPEQMWVMGRPEGDDYPERYRRMSALYHSEGLTKPLMITHATRDAVVLYSDTIALAERMIAQGKMFELVTLPGSSHVWAADSADQQRFGYRKMVEFFDRYLQPDAR
jgi:dipeptidyl-peptidase 4